MRYTPGDFYQIPNRHALRGLPAIVRSVYQSLCDRSDGMGVCFPSMSLLAEDAGCSVRPAYEAILTLCDLGLLQKVNRKKGKENLTNIYQLNILPVKGGTLLETEPTLLETGGVPYQEPSNDNHINDNHLTMLSDESKKTSVSLSEFMVSRGGEADEVYDGDGMPHEVWKIDGKVLTAAKVKKLDREWQISIGQIAAQKIIPEVYTAVVDIWNTYPSWDALKRKGTPPNVSARKVLLPPARLTHEVKHLIGKHSKHYQKEDFALAIKNYAQEICNRVPNETGYHLSRMSLYDFLLQKNGFLKFVNR